MTFTVPARASTIGEIRFTNAGMMLSAPSVLEISLASMFGLRSGRYCSGTWMTATMDSKSMISKSSAAADLIAHLHIAQRDRAGDWRTHLGVLELPLRLLKTQLPLRQRELGVAKILLR